MRAHIEVGDYKVTFYSPRERYRPAQVWIQILLSNRKINDISLFKKEKFFLNVLSYKNRHYRNLLIKKISPKKLKNFINLIHPNTLIG